MPDVFVSYSRGDQPKVRVIAEELEKAGLTVWWDPHIKTGSGFREEIAHNLDQSRLVVVVWSKLSVASRFVCDEADEGAQRGTLLPALIDLVDIPLGFRQIQTADLTRWKGGRNEPALKEFISTVVDTARRAPGRKPAPPPTPAPEREPEPMSGEPEPKKEKPARRERQPAAAHKARYTVTGRNIRIALLVRSFILAALITGGFAALAYSSDFVFPEVRPFLIAAIAALTFFSRYATFLADKAMGAASLKLLSGSFLTLLFFSALSIAPLITEARLYAGALEEVKIEGVEGADINGVAIGPGGRLMVTASDDGQAWLWDAKTGVGLGAFRKHENWVWQADFNPAGDEVVSASRDMTARVWDVANRLERLVLTGHRATVYDAKFSPDGTMIATGSGDTTIRLWNAETGEEIAVLEGHSDDVRSIAFSPDGQSLASASTDGTVRVWSVPRRAFMRTVGTGTAWNEVAWDRTTGRIGAVGDSGAVRVWTPSGARVMNAGVPGKAFGIAFTREGTQVAVGSIDGIVRVFDVASGNVLQERQAHQDGVRDVTADRDGEFLVSASRDNTALVWSAATGEELQVVGHIESAIRLPFPIDLPPVAMASRAPLPMDFAKDRKDLMLLAAKGLATAIAALMTGLLLKGLLSLTPLRGFARKAAPAVTGLGVAYYTGLMLSALPVEATMLWGTLLFGPAAVFALLRWLLAVSVLRA